MRGNDETEAVQKRVGLNDGGIVYGSRKTWFGREHLVPLAKTGSGYCPYCDPEIPDEWRACPVHRNGDG